MDVKFYSAFDAVAACVIFDIEYGINNKVVCAWTFNGVPERITRNTIRHSDAGDYFTKYGHRFYLNDFLRV